MNELTLHHGFMGEFCYENLRWDPPRRLQCRGKERGREAVTWSSLLLPFSIAIFFRRYASCSSLSALTGAGRSAYIHTITMSTEMSENRQNLFVICHQNCFMILNECILIVNRANILLNINRSDPHSDCKHAT